MGGGREGREAGQGRRRLHTSGLEQSWRAEEGWPLPPHAARRAAGTASRETCVCVCVCTPMCGIRRDSSPLRPAPRADTCSPCLPAWAPPARLAPRSTRDHALTRETFSRVLNPCGRRRVGAPRVSGVGAHATSVPGGGLRRLRLCGRRAACRRGCELHRAAQRGAGGGGRRAQGRCDRRWSGRVRGAKKREAQQPHVHFLELRASLVAAVWGSSACALRH